MWEQIKQEDKAYKFLEWETWFRENQIIFEKDQDRKIGRITVNRPDKLNAITEAMQLRLKDLVEEVEFDEDIKVGIIRGAGSCLTAGHDMSEIGGYYGLGKVTKPGERHRMNVRRSLNPWHGI